MKTKSPTLRSLMVAGLIATCLFTASCTFLNTENNERLETMGGKLASLTPSQQAEAMSRISDVAQQQEEELLENVRQTLQQGQMPSPLLQQLYEEFNKAMHSGPAPTQEEIMSALSDMINTYFDALFPKMNNELDTFLASLVNPSPENNTGTPGSTKTLPGLHLPAGTIIIETTQTSRSTVPTSPIQNPSEPPKQILISNLANNIGTLIPISSSNTIYVPNDPHSQLTLATNDVGNEITINSMLIQSANNINNNPMLGTYTGNFSGILYDMTSVGGTLSLTVGLTGPGYFDGNATLTNNGSGSIALDVYNYGNGSFSSSGSNSSSATVNSGIGTENVNDMHIDGGFSGSNANGNWNMTVGAGNNADNSGTFTTAK